MSSVIRLTPAAAAVCVLVACGGGGSANAPTPVVIASSGFAVDGYLSGAAVLCDSNGNGVADTGEISVTTNSSGGYSFPAGCSAALSARGGVSVDTGLPFIGVLKAPAGSSVITPLTTLLAEGLTQVQLKAALGPDTKSQFQVYADAPHAFFADYRPSYREAAAKDGWERLQAWFEANGVA